MSGLALTKEFKGQLWLGVLCGFCSRVQLAPEMFKGAAPKEGPLTWSRPLTLEKMHPPDHKCPIFIFSCFSFSKLKSATKGSPLTWFCP